MNVETPTLRSTLRGHEAPVNAATFSPDGSLLITSAGGEGPGQGRKAAETLVWDVAREKLAATLVWHRQAVLAAAVSPDGETLATGSRDQTVAIWNIGRGLWDSVLGICERSLRGHQGAVTTLAFSPNGGLLASGGDDQTIRLWDTRAWRQSATLAADVRAACRLAFSPDGRHLAVAWRSRVPASVWDVATCQVAFQLRLRSEESFENLGLAYSPAGDKLAVLSTDAVRVWDLASFQVLTEFGTKGTETLAYSPLGDCLATGGWEPGARAAVQLWDPATGMPRAQLQEHKLPVTALAFAPSGKLLASAGRDALVNLWSLGRPPAPLVSRFQSTQDSLTYLPEAP